MQKKIFIKYRNGRLQSVEDLAEHGKLKDDSGIELPLVDDRLYSGDGLAMIFKDWGEVFW